MRILITNNRLARRAGTELYVRDLALSLLARGHTPIAYSTVLGEVACELRAATVPVIDDLDALGDPPDLIHGHHHLETMSALLRFPTTPALFVCHGWLPWEELPPRHPRIRRYVAVDALCRERLIYERGVPGDQVSLVLNFVDLDRFAPRGPLPPRPRRALLLSNYATEENCLPTVRAACERAGLALDVAGELAGKLCPRPEAILPEYDLVFAKARCALEAMAVGAAVVLCDTDGFGPMVTTANFDSLRLLNFGIRTVQRPLRVEALLEEIDRYDPADAAAVHRRIRNEAGREAVVETLLELYREVMAPDAPVGAAAEAEAGYRYLREIGASLKEVAHLRRQLCERAEEASELRHCLREQQESLAVLRATTGVRLQERLQRHPRYARWVRPLARRFAGRVSYDGV